MSKQSPKKTLKKIRKQLKKLNSDVPWKGTRMEFSQIGCIEAVLDRDCEDVDYYNSLLRSERNEASS